MCGVLVYSEVTSTVAMNISGGQGHKKGEEDFKEMVGVFDVGCQGLNNGLEIKINMCGNMLGGGGVG